jgi:hypothetical protein
MVYASLLISLLFLAMPDDREDETPELALFELGGTEMPNPIVDDVLTVARDTLGIFVNMVAD